MPGTFLQRSVTIKVENALLDGCLVVPTRAQGVVVFAHGSGSSRHSPRNRYVASMLNQAGYATLLMDLLTLQEERVDQRTAHLRFDIELLAERLVGAIDWLSQQSEIASLPVGVFGASTGAGAALMAAAMRPEAVSAVVSRGGRPDLADESLPLVKAPTLLLVGKNDEAVAKLNEWANVRLRCERELHVVPNASHLFEEPGTLEEVARRAAGWFDQHFSAAMPQELHLVPPVLAPAMPEEVLRVAA